MPSKIVDDIRTADGLWVKTYSIDKKSCATRGYSLWDGINSRCRIGGWQQNNNPNYIGCENRFSSFQSFMEWATVQQGYYDGYCLDKDLLIKGNKLYSEETCVLLPQALNSFMTTANSRRGIYPRGVSFHKYSGTYKAACSVLGKGKTIGSFDNPVDAFYFYKEFKEGLAKDLAEMWKDKIDPRAYQGLLNYRVEITD